MVDKHLVEQSPSYTVSIVSDGSCACESSETAMLGAGELLTCSAQGSTKEESTLRCLCV